MEKRLTKEDLARMPHEELAALAYETQERLEGYRLLLDEARRRMEAAGTVMDAVGTVLATARKNLAER